MSINANRETRSTPTTRMPPPQRPRRAITALGAIAAVLVLAVLAASLFALLSSRQPSAHQPGPAAHPTPTLDRQQAQAYLDVMNTYYRPLGTDLHTDDYWHGVIFPHNETLQALVSERPVEARIVSEAQTFLAHLTVAPPPQWQADDGYLKNAARVTASLYAQLVARIDAGDLAGWSNIMIGGNLDQYCGPIDDINALLPPNGALQYGGLACQELPRPTPTP
jgi:hypothetical protein